MIVSSETAPSKVLLIVPQNIIWSKNETLNIQEKLHRTIIEIISSIKIFLLQFLVCLNVLYVL